MKISQILPAALVKNKKMENNIIRKVPFKNKSIRFSIDLDVQQSMQPTFKKNNSIFPKDSQCLEKPINKKFKYNGSFQEAVAPVLLMAQCFAIMPCVGITSKNASDLCFKWKSFRTIYSIILAILLLAWEGATIYGSLVGSNVFDTIVTDIFYGSVLYAIICFGFLALKWSTIMKKWESVENQLPPYKTQTEKSYLANKIKMVTIIVMCLTIIEHILSILSSAHYAIFCKVENPTRVFFLSHLSQFFLITSYTPTKAFFGKILNLISTFIWNYMDLFVMIISIGLSSRFKQINTILLKHKGQQMPEYFWIKNRKNYRNLCELCETVDTAIANITLISFANNLFFICVQLLRSLIPMASFVHALYFWFSLTYLIGRTLAVSLYAANINDEAKVPIQVFRSVPRESWCIEVKRFCDEVTNDITALSGMKFFYITRKLVLSVAGTIVTYELVLIQFHEEQHDRTSYCN